MKKTKIGVVLGFGSAIFGTLAEAVTELAREGYSLEVQARPDREDVDDEFCRWLKEEADAIILYISSYFEKKLCQVERNSDFSDGTGFFHGVWGQAAL